MTTKPKMASLKFAKVDRPINHKVTRTDTVRSRFIDACLVQKEYVDCRAKGQKFVKTREVKTKDDQGKPVTTTKEVRFVQWLFIIGSTYYIAPRYGAKKLNLNGEDESQSITCGKTLASVQAVLDTLIEATKAGELDDVLLAVSAKKA